MKYMVYLFNAENLGLPASGSVSNGKYGFVVRAENIKEAAKAARNRAKKYSFFDDAWHADITRLNARGVMDTGVGNGYMDYYDSERHQTIKLV